MEKKNCTLLTCVALLVAIACTSISKAMNESTTREHVTHVVTFYDRKQKKLEPEKVAGGKAIKLLYTNPFAKLSLKALVKRKFLSNLYGKYCDSKRSRKQIAPFIKNFEIDMEQSELQVEDFNCFNDFFIRKLKPAVRPIDPSENAFIACSDGRLMVFEDIDTDKVIQVKGLTYSLSELLQNEELAKKYTGGTCMVFRLNPTDYHRVHFIDSGVCSQSVPINGHYYSVNPVALKTIPELYCENTREYSLLKSENFGDIVYVEVGATFVGSIVQTYEPSAAIVKGEEKGYFKFGGSTVILFIEKDKVAVDDDILLYSAQNIETKVLMGETIGCKPNNND